MSKFKIHELPVYLEQITCAKNIMKIFNEKNTPVLLIAQMQQGKTGTVACVVSQFVELCLKQRKSYEVIYIINLSDNDIKEQTEIRFIQAGLRDEITVLHHKNIDNMHPSEVDLRLIIVDECHVALGKEKTFHKFMKRCGINYGNSIDTWQNKNNQVLSVSATPYAQIIKTKINGNTFIPVVLKMSQEYYSLQHMQNKNRIKQAKPMVDSRKEVTAYFEERIDTFLNMCLSDGKGYLTVRTRNPNSEIISDYLKQSYPSVSIQPFSCRNDNISMLDVTLKIKPKKPTVILISGSMRAGKTLTTTKHIKMWLDSHSSKSDTTCQSVGRCLGYSSDEHSKFNDKFSIYCCTKEIRESIEFFDKYNCSPNIPSGNWNKKVKDISTGEYLVLSENEIRDMYQQHAITISVCSKNNGNSIALIVLNNSNRGYSSDIMRIYHLDGPNPNFKDDFEKLMRDKPDFQGKFVVYKLNSNIEKKDIENYLNENAIFAERATQE